jgi:uncharacterized protein
MIIELITAIVKKLVDKPERVVVHQVEADGVTVIQIRVAPQDLSRVIGSEGRVFRALRTLANVVSPDHKDLVVDSAAEE